MRCSERTANSDTLSLVQQHEPLCGGSKAKTPSSLCHLAQFREKKPYAVKLIQVWLAYVEVSEGFYEHIIPIAIQCFTFYSLQNFPYHLTGDAVDFAQDVDVP